MRLVGALFLVAVASPVAFAEDAKPAEPKQEAAKAKFPLRVVRMLPETHQALLFDRIHGTHVLAAVGGTVEGYLVSGLDDDEVFLAAAGGAEIVLAAPEGRHHRDRRTADASDAPKPAITTTGPQPEDPYGEPVVRSVEAPRSLEAGDGGVRVTEAPSAVPTAAHTASAPAGPVSTTSSVPTAVSTTSSVPTAVSTTSSVPTAVSTTSSVPTAVSVPTSTVLTATQPTDDTVVIAKAELTTAIADFSKLAGSIRAAFTAAGVRVDAVAEGSLFAKAGLRSGDVISTVDGHALRSLEDTADLYARAQAVRTVGLQITRAGKPMLIRITIR